MKFMGCNMMTERQQIEEIAKAICFNKCKFCENCYFLKLAEIVYNTGYRKIDEGSVVLTKEEYETLKNEGAEIAKDYQEMARFYDEKCEELDQARQETAREILDKLDKESNGQTQAITNLLRKRYGVEE